MKPIAASMLLVIGLAAGCGGGPSAVTLGDFEDLGADAVLIPMESYMTTRGLLRGVLRADTAFMYDDSSKLHLRRPHVDIYDENGQPSPRITAREGDLYLNTELMIARGGVVLTFEENNRRITTEELNFDCQSNRIWSDSATTMVEGGATTRGSGFTADCQMNDLHIRDMRGTGLRIE